MVFVLRIDNKEELRLRLEGEGTSGGVTTKSQISIPLVAQGIVIFWQGEGEKNSRLKILIRANSQLWRHVKLECRNFQNIRHIEIINIDFMTIPWSQNIALPL